MASPEDQENGQGASRATESELPDDVETLRQRLQEEQQKAESFYGNWQRTAADFANFKRRTEQERSETSRFASSLLILSLLPVLDDLERALGNVPRELTGLTWIDGIELIYRKMLAVFESHGVAPIEAAGKPFDPAFHEAVVRAPGEEGKVLNELQRGYTLHGRVIRPALVSVGEGGRAAAEE